MTLKAVAEILDAKVLSCQDMLDTEIISACGSDLLSDVLAFVKDQGMLLTGLVNPQVIRTAEMMDMRAIVFVRGKMPTEEMINHAKEINMVIMSTDYALYLACGRLYAGGLYNI